MYLSVLISFLLSFKVFANGIVYSNDNPYADVNEHDFATGLPYVNERPIYHQKSKKEVKLDEKSYALEKLDSFYELGKDYSRFSGRVTDRDDAANILKISSENKNVKFFQAGDKAYFTIPNRHNEDHKCIGYVRNVEDYYFVLYVQDLHKCWPSSMYFRRGSQLYFNSLALSERVRQGALHRVQLLNKREDFFKQLNSTNHFLWSYEQQKVKLSAEYDKKILEMQRRKQESLAMLQVKKKDEINMQKELMDRLSQLDEDLRHYRIEKNELYADRWHLDHDTGLPISKRPQKIDPKRKDTVLDF